MDLAATLAHLERANTNAGAAVRRCRQLANGAHSLGQQRAMHQLAALIAHVQKDVSAVLEPARDDEAALIAALDAMEFAAAEAGEPNYGRAA